MKFFLDSLARIYFAIFTIGMLSLLSAGAQSRDEQRDQNKPGIALVKAQAWSRDDEVTVLEFAGFADRSVKTNPGAGYFEFRTAKSPSFQVPAGRVVKLMFLPELLSEIITVDQRNALQKNIEEFRAISTKFPTAARVLQGPLKEMTADASKYDSGYVKKDGQWVSRSSYYEQKANGLVEILRAELMSASHIQNMDLSSNQYFNGLQELAKNEVSVQPFVDSMRSLYDERVRKEQRSEILARLRAPDLTFPAAESLLKELKALRPTEDPESNKFVQSWDMAVNRARQLTQEVKEVQTAFESEMATSSEPLKPRKLSPELSGRVQHVATALHQFRSGSPPSVIQIPKALADAMIECANNLPSVTKYIEVRQYLEAKTLLDPIVRQAGMIGPNSAASLGVLQRKVTDEIEKFRALRDEAKILADNDKIEAAIKKYEEALAVIPEKEIAAQIEALKKQ